MSLEDHVGDVLAKARRSADLTAVAAAAAAGLSESEYLVLEETGLANRRPDFRQLATVLQLSAEKLQHLAAGWQPQVRELGRWRELRRLVTGEGGFKVNCYLVWDEATRDAALFDTGLEAPPVLEMIAAERLRLNHIFITHSHYDHVEALGPIRQHHPLARVHTSSPHAPPAQRNRADAFVHLGSLRVTNRDTPGHADDGVTYIIGNWPDDAPGVAVVGDALFAGSMGKAGANLSLAIQKVRDHIFTLPADTLICPGHGPVTTVGEERRHNPFFR